MKGVKTVLDFYSEGYDSDAGWSSLSRPFSSEGLGEYRGHSGALMGVRKKASVL
jgi:hypothetical protein